MLRSMYSGVSGLRGHQAMMDVIGNNIANVNTVGYKTAQVTFQDLLSQVVAGGAAPTEGAAGLGGVNPMQVGIGVKIGSITSSFAQGASQVTGRATDLSIQGDGFFIARDQNQTFYTRAGSLSLDALGRLITPDGSVIQGWVADAKGALDTNQPVSDISMPFGQTSAPVATQKVQLGGNLDATVPAAFPGPESIITVTVYDAQGKAVDLSFGFKMTSANNWSVQPYQPDGADADTLPDTMGAAFTLTFDPLNGQITAPATAPTVTVPNTLGQFPGPVTIDFGPKGSAESLRQFAGKTSVTAMTQDGAPMGSLQSFSIGPDGIVTGVFNNGHNHAIAQLALAGFANPAGLEKVGDSLYQPSANSGLAQVGTAGTGGRGTFMGATLEMSNVDLAQEFTNLIVSQRGFQANSRVITAADEILQDLVNLKR